MQKNIYLVCNEKKGKLFRILEFHEEEKTKKQIVKISITIR